jgi:hypothetical protein
MMDSIIVDHERRITDDVMMGHSKSMVRMCGCHGHVVVVMMLCELGAHRFFFRQPWWSSVVRRGTDLHVDFCRKARRIGLANVLPPKNFS